MAPIEIILIIIGIAIIVISCFIIDRNEYTKSAVLEQNLDHKLTIQELTDMKEHFNTMLHEVTEDTVVKTDNYLSQISNEKIMAVNEFSEEILQKIDHNHQEVVFLYQMLNDKENELKKAMNEVNETKKQVEELSRQVINHGSSKEIKNPVIKDQVTDKKFGKNKNKEEKESIFQMIAQNEEKAKSNVIAADHKQILALAKAGKSVHEISKELRIGQGEVKLVIDLERR